MKSLMVILCLVATVTLADVADNRRHEVGFLLNFVKQSACSMERNGHQYKGVSAMRYMQTQYQFYRNDIENTEDFVKFTATRNPDSGHDIKVRCPGKQVQKSGLWLLKALQVYRIQRQF